jgi:hypothetical protein
MKTTLGFSLFLSTLALALGCSLAAAKDSPLHQRGWIGGEFKTVTVFPIAFSNAPKAAILITALNSNTPAALAGLEAGDLILELDHQPAKKVNSVRRMIDQTKAGKALPVKLWHEGQIIERSICVGRETYQENGVFMVGLPGFFYAPKLWPFTFRSAGLSVVAAGFKPESGADRKELSSAEAQYFKNCHPKGYEVADEGWRAWMVIMQAETRKTIKSQDIVPAATASFLPKADQQSFGYLNKQ